MSKRLGTLSLRDLRAQGVEPMALLSLMARIGSSQPVELRTSMDELIEGFDLSSFGSAPTKFDSQDLFALTAQANHARPFAEVADEVAALGVPSEIAEPFWNVVRENITTRADMTGWWDLFRDGATPMIADEDKEFIPEAYAMLPEPPYTAQTWKEWTSAVKEATGRKGKGLFMPLRKAVTGIGTWPGYVRCHALDAKEANALTHFCVS